MAKRLTLLLVSVSLAGCASADATVTGLVTVNQKNLERGYITFYPIDGTANIQGCEIVDGAFQINQLPIGPRKAVISATPSVEAVQHGTKGTTLKLLPGSPIVTPTTKGNAQTIDLRAGQQSLEFALHVSPSR